MELSNEEYGRMVEERSAPSPIFKNTVWAFLVGGGICALGQWLGVLYQSLGAEKELAGSLVSISLIALSALLTGLGWFDRIATRAGAGTLVPITGFANAVVSPALEFHTENPINGSSSKMFTIAGPVLVYGLSASVVYGGLFLLFGK